MKKKDEIIKRAVCLLCFTDRCCLEKEDFIVRDKKLSSLSNLELQSLTPDLEKDFFDNDLAVGWCNANDRTNFYHVGEFGLGRLLDDCTYSLSCQ